METPAPGPRVGTRVAMRYRLTSPDPSTGARLTDVVGELVASGPESLTVRSRHGEVVVPRRAVTALKEVPPRPSRRGAPHRAVSAADLERAMVGAWPPVETGRLGEWVLRSSGGFTQRASSALAVGDPGLPLEAALEAVETWYADRGRPSWVSLPLPHGASPETDPLVGLLTARGYESRVPTVCLTASAAHVAASAASSPARVPVRLSPTLEDGWMAAYRSYREADPDLARAVLTGSPAQVFASVAQEDGEVVAVGRLGLASAWGGVAAMWTAPTHRRRGIATAVLGALAEEAVRRDVASLHLQTDGDNAGALSTYRRHGFTPHHDYVTLRRP